MYTYITASWTPFVSLEMMTALTGTPAGSDCDAESVFPVVLDDEPTLSMPCPALDPDVDVPARVPSVATQLHCSRVTYWVLVCVLVT